MDTPFEAERQSRKSGWANGVVKTLGFELGSASCNGSGSDESVGAEAFTANAVQLAYALKGLSLGGAEVPDPDTPIGLPSHADPSKRMSDAFCKARVQERVDACGSQSPSSYPGSPHRQGRPQSSTAASNAHRSVVKTQGCGTEAHMPGPGREAGVGGGGFAVMSTDTRGGGTLGVPAVLAVPDIGNAAVEQTRDPLMQYLSPRQYVQPGAPWAGLCPAPSPIPTACGGTGDGLPSVSACSLHVLPDQDGSATLPGQDAGARVSAKVPDQSCSRALPDEELLNGLPDQARVLPSTAQPSQPAYGPGLANRGHSPPLPDLARGSHMPEGEGKAEPSSAGTGERAGPVPVQARDAAGECTEPVLASEGLLKEHLFEMLVERVVPANAQLSASATSAFYVKYLMPGEEHLRTCVPVLTCWACVLVYLC